ncbi:MAG: hypothetical protein HY867_06495 [Chloroflexi bacterium]|nr:hypothetical protein [Chloroflexota bacterium]
MNGKIIRSLFYIIPTFLLTGCITVFVPVNTPTPPPTPIPLATIVISTTTEAPALPSPTATHSAPVCRVDPLADVCSVPNAGTLTKNTCIKKVPYTLLGFSPGSIIEIADPNLTCKNEGLRGGVQQYSCTGQQLISYDIKVCNPTCTAALDTTSGLCSTGYGYDSAAGCCWPVPDLEPGCMMYRVDIGACQ